LRLELEGKELAALSWGAAVGAKYEGGGFATFFDENVKNELSLEEPAELVSCEESVCATYYGTKILITSYGTPLREFEVGVAPNWVLLDDKVVYLTYEEGVVAYSLEGKRLWRGLYGPARGAARAKGLIYVGTPFGALALSHEDGKVVKEVELGNGSWRVTSSCGSTLLLVNDEEASALALLAVKDLGDPEPVGEVKGVTGTPWISPDCLYVAVPSCGVSVFDLRGNLVFSQSLEGNSDECYGVQAHWGEKLLVGVVDEGLMKSYVLTYEPFSR